MPRLSLQWRQGFQITRVSQLVQINDWLIAASQPVQNEVGANKTGTAGDKNGHEKVKVIVRLGNRLERFLRGHLVDTHVRVPAFGQIDLPQSQRLANSKQLFCVGLIDRSSLQAMPQKYKH